MNKKNKILICTLVAIAMIGIYINSNNRTLNQGENSELSQLTTLNNALEEELPLLIEFVTPTWPSCVKMESSIKELQEELEGKANIVIINANLKENAELSQMFGVRVVPTLVFMDKEKNPVKIIEGYTSKDDLYKYFIEAGVE